VSSGGESDALASEEIEGVFNLSFRLPGLTADSSEKAFFDMGPALWTRLVDDPFDGVGGIGDNGSG
tara:strand:- start:1621 stop:1818 length:198 start_codon:yes stop_codon:yes gene_type:complete